MASFQGAFSGPAITAVVSSPPFVRTTARYNERSPESYAKLARMNVRSNQKVTITRFDALPRELPPRESYVIVLPGSCLCKSSPSETWMKNQDCDKDSRVHGNIQMASSARRA
jgi:hypothetical protein